MENLENSQEFITICAWCGKKKEKGEWVEFDPEIIAQIEKEKKTSHGICPDCFEKMTKDL